MIGRIDRGRASRVVLTIAVFVAAIGSTVPAQAAVDDGQPDFTYVRWKLQELTWNQRPWNDMAILPKKTRTPADADGVPLHEWRGGDGDAVYNPTVMALEGMRRLDSWKRTGKPVHLRVARAIADKLDDLAAIEKSWRWQPHRYANPSQDLETRWVNANSQGYVLAFFVRFFELRGRSRDRRAAGDLFRSFLLFKSPDQPRWISRITDAGYLWLEHYPDGRQVGVLNAQMNAIFGLYDYWRLTGTKQSKRVLMGAITTVRDKLPDFRRPDSLSAYSLTEPIFTLHYHHVHIRQLRKLGRITGAPWFTTKADRFREDELAWRETQ